VSVKSVRLQISKVTIVLYETDANKIKFYDMYSIFMAVCCAIIRKRSMFVFMSLCDEQLFKHIIQRLRKSRPQYQELLTFT